MIFSNNYSKEIKRLIAQPNTFIVTDENVFNLYKDLFKSDTVFVMSAGEASKTLDTVIKICEFLKDKNADRQSHLFAIGGGVVGDTAGFAASIYMRGIAWTSVPTTLLAQCDSGIGGKTGVNFSNLKNILGTFYQPKQIIISAHFVDTLPEREFMCGVGELVKTAALCKKVFAKWTLTQDKILAKDHIALFNITMLAAKFKEKVVKKDLYEKRGIRKILNYGHTVGHAFESADNQTLSHGEYVLHGILYENLMLKDLIDPMFYYSIEAIIKTVLSDKKLSFDANAVVDAACSDKKNQDKKISILSVIKPGIYYETFLTKDEFKSKLLAAKGKLKNHQDETNSDKAD